jgi:hypothetical protein
MRFIARLSLDALGVLSPARRQTLLIFMCGADPGMCADFDPESGGNAALLVDSSAAVGMAVPPGPTLLGGVSPVRPIEYDDTPNESGEDPYCDHMVADSTVLGKAGGAPHWIQNDETPQCPCGRSMTFVAQLEDRGAGGINFGDAGTGYAFVCHGCPNQARFLWQCS